MSEVDRLSSMSFPRPGRALWGVMLALFAVWLAFAIGLNWGGMNESVFALFVGNTQRVLHGEVWRLFTAPLLNVPNSVGAIAFTLFGFYFLTPTLEREWGGARLIRFLVLSCLTAYVFQMAIELALPRSLAAKLVGDFWFSPLPALEAVSIAWALTFRGQTVRLFFIFPVTSRGLILFVVGVSVLYVVTLERPMCGLIAPFGGMLAGWAFGGSTPSPARKLWLKLRLAQLEREVEHERRAKKQRLEHSGLKVIDGGRGKQGTSRDDDRGPDGRLLN